MERVLIVEDDGIQAFVVARILGKAGYEIAGPCLTLQQAFAVLEEQKIDAAVLDIGVGEGFCPVLADRLSEAGIPFGFISGYGPHVLSAQFRLRPYLAKPWSDQDLVTVLHGMVASVNRDKIAS